MDEDLLARMNDGEKRDRILEEFNASTLDPVGPVGGAEQGMKVLSEMNSLTDDHDAFVKSLMPTIDVL
jgi:hypothetical protein